MDRATERMLVDTVQELRSRCYGKYRGVVQAVDAELGRIVAQVPEVYGTLDSPWALPAAPFAGNGHGLVLLPQVGDGVWIEFEGGDISRPLWSGAWWASDEMPSPAAEKVFVLITPGGHKLILDDNDDKIQLVHSGGGELTMTSNDVTLKIGSSQIVLSSSGVSVNNGALEVK
jgi:uncharacterized protein involved in type VI secretion and phage assembly